MLKGKEEELENKAESIIIARGQCAVLYMLCTVLILSSEGRRETERSKYVFWAVEQILGEKQIS